MYNQNHGGLAQLGERTLHRGDVAGSSPVASIFFFFSKPPKDTMTAENL